MKHGVLSFSLEALTLKFVFFIFSTNGHIEIKGGITQTRPVPSASRTHRDCLDRQSLCTLLVLLLLKF